MVKTIAVIDFAHCGTTMIAGICEILGVPMVAGDYHQMKWEDHEIILPAKDGDEQKLLETVAARNEKYPAWGFKFPGMLRVYPALADMLTDPVYIAIYKDLVSVTRRRFGTSNNRLYKKMLNTARQMERSVRSIAASGLDIHLLSYCKFVYSPLNSVLHLVDLTGIVPSEERVNRAASYVSFNTEDPRASYPPVKGYL